MAGVEDQDRPSGSAKITRIRKSLTGEIFVEDDDHPLVHPLVQAAADDMAAEAGGVIGGLPLHETRPLKKPTRIIITTERSGRFPRTGRRPV